MSRRASEPSVCAYCGQVVIWARHRTSGKAMPFDPEPYADHGSGWSLYHAAGSGETRCHHVRNAHVPLRQPHFSTCPNYRPRAPEAAPPPSGDAHWRQLYGDPKRPKT